MEWPEYLHNLAIAFDFPGFHPKEIFNWEKLNKDLKELIFSYLYSIKDDGLFKKENLRLVNKEFYKHFYKNKPKACIILSFKYHYKLGDLSHLLLNLITPNNLKAFNYEGSLYYHMLVFYFNLNNEYFDMFFIDSSYPDHPECCLLLFDYLKSINFQLSKNHINKFLEALLKLDDLNWIDNRFDPAYIINNYSLDADSYVLICEKYNIKPDFKKYSLDADSYVLICEKYNIKPDFKKISEFLYTKSIISIENVKKLLSFCSYDEYIELLKRIYTSEKKIINEIFRILTDIPEKDFLLIVERHGNNEIFLSNEKLWPLFEKYREKLSPSSIVFLMSKELFPFDFNYIKLHRVEDRMNYIGYHCSKEQLLELKKDIKPDVFCTIKIREEYAIYCIYFYIMKRFPEIYEAEFLSGDFESQYSSKCKGLRKDLLNFPFKDKNSVGKKLVKINYYGEIEDDEIHYFWFINYKKWKNYHNERLIKISMKYKDLDTLYKIFEAYKRQKETKHLINLINELLTE